MPTPRRRVTRSDVAVGVSVCVTTYEHEAYIGRALESVLSQRTDFPVEVIVGEDRSTDRTREIVEDFARRFPDRVITVLPDENLGAGGKRIFARTLELCRGEYIAMLDGDDYWTAPDKLSRQVEFLEEHPECSMCFHDVGVVDEDGKLLSETIHTRSTPPPRSGMEVVLTQEMKIPACSPMFRREVISRLPDWYFEVAWGDWPLYILAAQRGAIGYLDRSLGAYRSHPGGMWTGMDSVKRLHMTIDLLRRVRPVLAHSHHGAIRRHLSTLYFRLALAVEREGRVAEAQRYAWRALRLEPGTGFTESKDMVRMLTKPITRAWRRALGRGVG